MIRLAGDGIKIKEMSVGHTINRNSFGWRTYYFNHNLNCYPDDVTVQVNYNPSYPNLMSWLNPAHQEGGWWGHFWEPASSDELNVLQVSVNRETNGTHGVSTTLSVKILYK